MTAQKPFSHTHHSLYAAKNAVRRFKPKSLLGLSISLLMWQPNGWADPLVSALPVLNEETTPQQGFDTQINGTTLTVNQTADKVILNWDSFNIGERNAVHFEQVANGLALNRILDQAPSQILGSLTATGSIYLLNPNGVLFGKNSQVHVGNLLVSTQEVDTEQFLKSNINNAIKEGKPALVAPGQLQGSIDIEKGAHLSTESGGSVLVFAPSITNAGTIRTPDGQTVLAASEDKVYLTSSDQDPDLRGVFVEVGTGGDVTNLGEIVAERGNVTLMGLAVNQDGRVRATSSVDVNGTIRMLARDGAKTIVAGTLTEEQRLAIGVDKDAELIKGSNANSLVISNHTGNLTLKANSLTQVSLEQPPQAVLVDESSFTVAAINQLKNLAGSKTVDIQDASGQLFKGLAVNPETYVQWQQSQPDSPRRVRVLSAEGYIEQLVADRINGASAVDGSKQNPSKVELYGQQVEIEQFARVEAKGGDIRVVATDGQAPMKKSSTLSSTAESVDASIHIAAGAQLDVSGADVTLAMERNSIEVEVRGNEVRDQPLQRDGVLRGKKVLVDARVGTEMVDIQGSLDRQAKNIAERSAKGGRIQILSEGYTDLDATSQVNIKGGKINYTSGQINTTGLVKDGKVVDISDADPNQVYESVKTLSRYEAGYTDVQDAGSLEIKTRSLQMDASLLAGQAVGQRQLSLKDQPDQGTLSLNLNHFTVTPGQSVWLSPLRPEGMDQDREMWLNPALINAAGLSRFDLFLRGDLTQERGADIHLAPGGSFTAYGQDILLAGGIDAAGGSIDISSRAAIAHDDYSDETIMKSPQALGQHNVHVLSGARLDASGNWVNRSAAVVNPTQSVAALDGGSINLSSRGDLQLDAGATLAADSGALLAANSSLSFGKGGAISLQAKYPATDVTTVLDAQMSARGFNQNGSLSIDLPQLQIGSGTGKQNLQNPTILNYDFFAAGGFGKFSFATNYGGIDILGKGQEFKWQQRNWVMKDFSFQGAASSRSVTPWVTTQLLPDYLRKPVSLSIKQTAVTDEAGTAVSTQGYIHLADQVDWVFDPLASLSLTSINQLYLGGSISAPGGNLSFTLQKPRDTNFYDASSALWLGDQAWLSVAGTTVERPTDANLRLGKIIDAGSISFNLATGRLVTEEGSGIDLSAVSGNFDVLTATGYERQTRGANAGSLLISLSQGLIWQSHITAQSYRELGARGANMSVELRSELELGYTAANNEKFPWLERGIDIYAQRQQNLLDGFDFGDELPAHLVLDESEQAQSFGRAVLFAEDINQWQLDDLALNTTASTVVDNERRSAFADVSFQESVGLNLGRQLTLDTQDLRVLNEAEVSVAAPLLKLGESRGDAPLKPLKDETPLPGNGYLSLTGGEVELAGNLRIRGAAQTDLNSHGSVLAYGTEPNANNEKDYLDTKLSTEGDLSVISAVLYPGSMANIILESTAARGTVEIASNGREVPQVLSAGGRLAVKAQHIEISGAISAPFGKVSLEAEDVHLASSAQVSVSGDNQLIPLGFIIGNDLDWLYSRDPQKSDVSTVLLGNTPQKQVSIKAEQILLDEGSRIDLSGGGDILGYQFTPGPNGSSDVLASSSLTDGFALLPATNFVAYDSALQGRDAIPTGSHITLSNNPLLPTGDYYLLPSRYALLPGAYWVKPTGTLQSPGSSQVQADGGVTITGKLGLANTAIQDADWRGFTFYKSSYDGKSAELELKAPNGMANYKLRLSDSFYSNRSGQDQIPHAADAGSLVLDAQQALRLSSGIIGEVATAAMGARVDILGTDIHLVDSVSQDQPGLNLLAEDLSKLKVGSTLIGGQRSDDRPGHLQVSAKTLSVEANAKVEMPTILLVAKEEVRVKSGAKLTASSLINGAPEAAITVDNPAAVLRLSANQTSLVSTGTDTSKLVLEKGAILQANAIATKAGQTYLNSTLAINKGGALSMAAANIQLGGTNPNSQALPTGESDSSGTDNWLYFGADFFAPLELKDLSLQASKDLRLASGLSFSAGNLTLAAATISGTAGDKGVSITANQLNLSGALNDTENKTTLQAPPLIATAPSPADAGTGEMVAEEGAAGSLNMRAKQIFLGQGLAAQLKPGSAGLLSIAGFNQVSLTGEAGITGLGNTQVTVSGDLNLSGSLTTQQQSALSLHSTGLLTTHKVDKAPTAAINTNTGLGGSLSLSAARMEIATELKAASGQVHLISEQDVSLLAGASLDVAGVSRKLNERTLYTPGGNISVESRSGKIALADQANILFGAEAGKGEGGGAGNLTLSAAQGSIELVGAITGRTGDADGGGGISLDAKNLGDVSKLAGILTTTFDTDNSQSQISLRQRQGDINIGTSASLSAGAINVTADQGAIDLAGKLFTASGQLGLWAKGDINLSANSVVGAQQLSLSSETGSIKAAQGSQLLKGDADKPAQLSISAGKTGLLGSNIQANLSGWNLDAQLWLRKEVVNSVEFTQLAALNADAEAFLTDRPDLFTALTPGQVTTGGISLNAELYSSKDLQVSKALDLSTWRLGKTSENSGRAGRLVLRSGGNLYLNASISDGFVADTSQWGSKFLNQEGSVLDALMSEDSSHISLISGADLTSSNNQSTLAHQDAAGSMFLASGVSLRTGTGDITIASQGDLDMADGNTTTIYTAGKTQMRQYAGSDEALPDYGSVNPYMALDSTQIASSLNISKVYYPEQGGDIKIRTGGSIEGSNSHQLINEWLHRAAGEFVALKDPANAPADLTDATTRSITTWGIGFQDFAQGIASLGGGNLSIQSGGDINNLAVSAANTGKAVGELLDNQVQQTISGAVSIYSAGDINSGRWYAANNHFEVTSLGKMGNSAGELSTIIALGNAPIKLTATGDIAVEDVFNPTQVTIGLQQFGSNPIAAASNVIGAFTLADNYFSTYGQASSTSFTSLAGDVNLLMSKELAKQPLTSQGYAKIPDSGPAGLNLLPGRLNVASFEGDINVMGSLVLAPQIHGGFNLFAGNSVTAHGEVAIKQLDISPLEFGTLSRPLTTNLDEAKRHLTLWNQAGLMAINNENAHAAESVFFADTENNSIYTAGGDIGKASEMTSRFIVVSAKGLDIRAGGDLRDTSVIFHHQDASQHSSISTAGDVLFSERLDGNNKLNDNPNNGLLVLGPGSLRIQAGGSINLSTSEGIQSVGKGEQVDGRLNIFNPYLPDKAADLFISAGLNKTPNYSSVIAQYLQAPSAQGNTFIALADEASPERLINQLNLLLSKPVQTIEQARSQFKQLPTWQQQQVALAAVRTVNTAATPNYSRELVAFVTAPGFDQRVLQNAFNAELGLTLEGSLAVQNYLAGLPIEQQHTIALKALENGSKVLARNFLDGLVLSEIRQGGEAAILQKLKLDDPEGYERGYAALSTLYPGIGRENNPWQGNLAIDNTKIRTAAAADVNILLPGGNFEVGLEAPTLDAKALQSKGIGLVLGSYGDINVAAAGSINVNKSRIFNLGGGDVMLWSSYGDVDAGKGAKTALSVPPPKVQIDPNTGASRLVFPPAVAGSGIQATNPTPSNDPRAAISDGADVLLFAPAGIVDAGDAGISSTGNILVGALEFVGRDNVAGNVTISVGSDTAVTLPAGSANAGNDAAQSAEKAADNASGEQKEEKRLAYLTIELLGPGEEDEDDEEEKRKKRAN